MDDYEKQLEDLSISEDLSIPEGMLDSFIGPYESTPESIAAAAPDTSDGIFEPEPKWTATKKLMFLYVGKSVNDQGVVVTYPQYTLDDMANFGGITEYVLCAGSYGPYGTGPFTDFIAAMKATLETVRKSKGASARVWMDIHPSYACTKQFIFQLSHLDWVFNKIYR